MIAEVEHRFQEIDKEPETRMAIDLFHYYFISNLKKIKLILDNMGVEEEYNSLYGKISEMGFDEIWGTKEKSISCSTVYEKLA